MNRGLFKGRNHEKLMSYDDWTWLEYNFGGWNVGEQAHVSCLRLARKLVE